MSSINTTFNAIQDFVSQLAGVEEDLIVPDAHFEQDLGVSKVLLPQIVQMINEELDTEFDFELFTEEPYEEQTVETLARLMSDELLLTE